MKVTGKLDSWVMVRLGRKFNTTQPMLKDYHHFKGDDLNRSEKIQRKVTQMLRRIIEKRSEKLVTSYLDKIDKRLDDILKRLEEFMSKFIPL